MSSLKFSSRLLPTKIYDCEIAIAPPFTALSAAVEATKGTAIAIAAQNAHWEREGGFTGEVSMGMIVEAGARGVIIGHSERRQYFGETDETVNRKLRAALEAGLASIVCVGEFAGGARREASTTLSQKRQFEGAFAALTDTDFSRILLRVRTRVGHSIQGVRQRLKWQQMHIAFYASC